MIANHIPAEKAIDLLQQLADQSSAYRETLVTLVIPALKALPPTQDVDYSFFCDKPAPQFDHLTRLTGIKTEWLNVIIGANEWVIVQNMQQGLTEESALTSQVREWIGYTLKKTPDQ